MEKLRYLYRITNILDNKVYIGQTVDPARRWYEHRRAASHQNPPQHIHRAIKKYGNSNFNYEIIAISKTKSDADISEKLLIQQYDSRNEEKGYNLSIGGEHAARSEEGLKAFIEKTSGDKHWIRKPENQEIVLEMRENGFGFKLGKSSYSKGLVGELHPRFNKHHSEESKAKISSANKGRAKSEETKEKIRIGVIESIKRRRQNNAY